MKPYKEFSPLYLLFLPVLVVIWMGQWLGLIEQDSE